MNRARLFSMLWWILWSMLIANFSHAQSWEVCVSNQESIASEFLWNLANAHVDWSLVATLAKYKDTSLLKNTLVEYYCDTWFLTHDTKNTDIPNINNSCVDSGTMRYDPRQSLFMYGLCVGYDESHKGKTSLKDSDWKTYVYRNRKQEFEKLTYSLKTTKDGSKNVKIKEDISKYIPSDSDDENLLYTWRGLDSENDPCLPENWMTECLMGYPTNNILTNVFAWLFDLKKAAIDGYNHGTTDKDIELAIKDFTVSLYDQPWVNNSICNNDDKQFIMKQDSWSNDKQSHCWHYKTRWQIQAVIKSAIKDVDRVKELDGHAIAEAKCLWLKETMIPCAMSNLEEWTEWAEQIIFWSEEKAWRNVILNELFFAGLRIEYYAMIIESEPSRQLAQWGSILDKNKRIIEVEIAPMRNNFAMIERSVDRMINLLAQYRSMYHQCISLKAYQEDMDYFWTRVNKSYTPTHQLHYLKQDAQEMSQ